MTCRAVWTQTSPFCAVSLWSPRIPVAEHNGGSGALDAGHGLSVLAVLRLQQVVAQVDGQIDNGDGDSEILERSCCP